MSNNLFKVTLCNDDEADWDKFLASLQVAATLLECDGANIATPSAATAILNALMTSWGGLTASAKDFQIYYYDADDCSATNSVQWVPMYDACTLEGAQIASVNPGDVTFSAILGKFVAFFNTLSNTSAFADVEKALHALCDIVKQRIMTRRYIQKAALTVGHCDL
jgi:hypothetical protein